VPYLAFLFICLTWGASFILMNRASHALGPVDVAIGRMALGAATLAVYCAVTKHWGRFQLRDLVELSIVSALANSWPYVVQPYVMHQAGEHGFFGLMVAFVPLATIAASIPILGVWPTPRQFLGVIGGLACAALIMWDGAERGISPGLLALSISTPITYAFGNIYIKWRFTHLPSAPFTAVFLALGAAVLVPLEFMPGLLTRLRLSAPPTPHNWPQALASLAFLGIVGTGIAIVLFVYLVKTQGPLFAGMVTYVVPMLALVWGQYDGERLTAAQLASIAGVLAMVALVQWRAAVPVPPTGEPPA
jgi:drug/metabolite transporter (DMT)-like permease